MFIAGHNVLRGSHIAPFRCRTTAFTCRAACKTVMSRETGMAARSGATLGSARKPTTSLFRLRQITIILQQVPELVNGHCSLRIQMEEQVTISAHDGEVAQLRDRRSAARGELV